jgi:hypothetical protein
MTRYLSVPPDLNDAAIQSLETTLARPADGELVVLAGHCSSFSPFGVAELRAMVDAERYRGERVTLEPPQGAAAMRRLSASGFLADLGIRLEPEPRWARGARWPGLAMRRIADPEDLVAFSTAAWRATRPYGRRLAHIVLQASEELAGNALEHAVDPLAPIAILELTRRGLELAVVDRGVGVRASLVQQGRNVTTDTNGLLEALGQARRKVDTIGLPVLGRLVTGLPGLELILRSGHGGVRVAGDGQEIEEYGVGIVGMAGVLRRSS